MYADLEFQRLMTGARRELINQGFEIVEVPGLRPALPAYSWYGKKAIGKRTVLIKPMPKEGMAKAHAPSSFDLDMRMVLVPGANVDDPFTCGAVITSPQNIKEQLASHMERFLRAIERYDNRKDHAKKVDIPKTRKDLEESQD